MGGFREFFRRATILGTDETPPQEGLMIVKNVPDISEEGRSNIAEQELRESGIWDALQAFAEGLPDEKNAAVDFGYLDDGKFEPVGALRFAPLPGRLPDEPVTSKILGLVPGIDAHEIRYSKDITLGAGLKIKWEALKFTSADFGGKSFSGKMALAMGNATARMVDNRIRVATPIGDKYEGNPGIGRIK